MTHADLIARLESPEPLTDEQRAGLAEDFAKALGWKERQCDSIPEGWNLLSLYNCMGGWEAELVGLGDEYGNFPSARGKAPTMARALAAAILRAREMGK